MPRTRSIALLVAGLVLLLVASAASCGARSTPGTIRVPEGVSAQVHAPVGPIVGVRADDLRVFLGIPYAAAPVGPNRFRPPKPAPHFQTPFDATHAGPMCPQLRRGTDPQAPAAPDAPVDGDEDCLSLNVWARTDAKSHPVMVFVHGGAFQQGSGSKPFFEGSKLARDAAVVVVTVNYRLGTLGLLALEALARESGEGSAGNYAIRDQIAALKWVRENIAAFGGDPANVTVFGESAGAASVCALVASPLAADLFQRGIIESGGGCHALPSLREGAAAGAPSAFERGKEVVDAAGCGTAPDVLACLRALDAATLVRAGTHHPARSSLLTLRFSPVVDGVVLTASLYDRLERGEISMPLIIGTNADEASLFVRGTDLENDEQYAAKLREWFGERAEAVAAIFPPTLMGDPNATLARVLTEAGFVCPSLALAEVAARSKSPVYAYHFVQKPRGILGEKVGAFHGIELAYLFWGLPSFVEPNEDEQRMIRIMRDAWGGFARTGAPKASPAWPAYAAATPAIYQLELDPSVVRDVSEGRCARLREAGAFGNF